MTIQAKLWIMAVVAVMGLAAVFGTGKTGIDSCQVSFDKVVDDRLPKLIELEKLIIRSVTLQRDVREFLLVKDATRRADIESRMNENRDLNRKAYAYLDAALVAGRGIRANREVSFLSSAYSLTAMRKRLARVNPCYGVRRNSETARTHYVEGADLRRYNRDFASRRMRCYVLLKYLIGLRQSDMLKLTQHHLTSRGIEAVIGKTLTRSGKKIRFRWTWALRIVVKAILGLPRWTEAQRKKKRKHPLPTSIYLFNTDENTPLTNQGFKSQWARSQAKFAAAGHTRFWEHDIRAKTGSDSKSDQAAQELLGHDQASTTKRHYRRGISKVSPLR
jgi:integrase